GRWGIAAVTSIGIIRLLGTGLNVWATNLFHARVDFGERTATHRPTLLPPPQPAAPPQRQATRGSSGRIGGAAAAVPAQAIRGGPALRHAHLKAREGQRRP